MSMLDANTPANVLARLIDDGAFEPRVEEYLNRLRKITPYTTDVSVEGVPAAERKLAAQARNYHYKTFSACIAPIARSIVTMAAADSRSLVDITHCTPGVEHSTIRGELGPRHKFVVMNGSRSGNYDFNPPEESLTWGPGGEFGLRAVILETGSDYNGPRATLTLVLPAWMNTGPDGNLHGAKQGTIFLAKFHTSGSSNGSHYDLFVCTGEGSDETRTEITNATRGLEYMLGLTTTDGRLGDNAWLGGIDNIGFPGARSYLAAKLPELGSYFEALAKEVNRLRKR